MIFLDGDYLGALAAARHLGRQGVPCYLAGKGSRSILSYSKFVTELRLKPYRQDEPDSLCAGLLALPSSFTGAVLYPASDDSAYFLSRFGDKLRSRFKLNFPSEDVIMALLDKERLYSACSEWGIPYPHTQFPAAVADTHHWQGGMPALIKPKTQIYINVQKKGDIVLSAQDLNARYARYLAALSYRHGLAASYPKLDKPMIQAFHKEAQTDTISVSGYFHPSAPLPVALFTQKVLQKPKNIGIGLCFKAVAPIPQLAGYVDTICRQTGYYGVFEAEFIHLAQQNRYLLMDFNPRLYSQMQFDIMRGSLLPDFYYRAALSDDAGLAALYHAHSKRLATASKDRYSSFWYLRFTYLTQVLAGKVSLGQMRQILNEYGLSHPSSVDASFCKADPKPYYFDQWRSYGQFLRHPRDTYRKFFKDVG